MLADLSPDELEGVTRHLSPAEVGRLKCTCLALAIAATPTHAAWAWLRTTRLGSTWGNVRVAAVAEGKLEALRWACAQECTLHVSLCNLAVMNGHLEALKLLRAQMPPALWGVAVCQTAAARSRLGALQWLRTQTPPCPWGATTCLVAATQGHLVMLRWLRAQAPPCQWNVLACLAASPISASEMRAWLEEERELLSEGSGSPDYEGEEYFNQDYSDSEWEDADYYDCEHPRFLFDYYDDHPHGYDFDDSNGDPDANDSSFGSI